MSSEAPPDWMVIETVARLQRLARHQHCPTQPMIFKTINEASDIRYDYEAVNERLEYLRGQRVLMRYPGDYYSSVRWKIHPAYVPEPPIPDPYTEEQRAGMLARVNEREQEEAREAERAREIRRKKDRERSRLRRIEERRRKARSSLDRQRPDDINGGFTDCVGIVSMIEEDPGDVLILDTETTGLYYLLDDVLELSIINGAGRTVYSRRFAAWKEEWPDAQRIHGIGPKDVEGLSKLEDEAAKISELLRGAKALAGYNLTFDLAFLTQAGVRFPRLLLCDVMEEFAEVYGEWADWIEDGEGGWKWQTLTTAGRHYHIDTQGAHGSLRDCQITLEVLRRMAREPEAVRHRE